MALKLLPDYFTSDPARVRRFQQEARAVGRLNHPNILIVHDIGTHEGAPYIVSELLEGQTLRQCLSEGALPVPKALEYARQMASGLTAAHDKGIVHRDLKPENLFVTTDGRVKILDFGLAKLKPPQVVDGMSAETGSSVPQTNPGVVMGTVGYMSPEQVRGEAADHRSDIFSFGVILYEMVTGQRPFRGESGVEVMNAILKEEVPELQETARDTGGRREGIPPQLERIVRHCLEKPPRRASSQ